MGSGLRCLDLGCGGGAVTLEIAQLIVPTGDVIGIDQDAPMLASARQAAADHGLTNVTFRALNVDDWDEPATYDVVFCWFLLQHLSQPVDLLCRMWAAVRPGGVIIVEDADFDGWCCHPANEGFTFFLRTYAQVLAHRGGDHAIGRKLYRYFLDASIAEPCVDLVYPAYIAGEGKLLALSTLEATAEAIVSEGLASTDEVNAALAQLGEITADPHSLIAGPRLFQLWARR